MGGGTLAGRWRMVKTMGQRITKLNPFSGFATNAAGALTLMGTAHFRIPVSTRHRIAGAIVGVGALRRLTGVHWGRHAAHRVGLGPYDSERGSLGAILDHLLRRWGS
jgi:phosphate/sulfate permease